MIIDGYTADAMLNQQTTGTLDSETANPPQMVGWICPVCGRGLSPFTTVCPCKNDQKGYEITC